MIITEIYKQIINLSPFDLEILNVFFAWPMPCVHFKMAIKMTYTLNV